MDFDKLAYKSPFNFEKVLIFTNANYWYIDSLVNNLLTSAARHEPDINIVLFCTDIEGYNKSQELGIPNVFHVNMPPFLGADKLVSNTDSTTDGYTKLSFVKIFLMKYILDLGYIGMYLDPDMAFTKKSISSLLNYSLFHELVCAGVKSYINSNILIARPTNNNKQLFDVQEKDIIEVLNAPDKYGDEDYLRPRLREFACLDTKEYPAGCDAERFIDTAKIIHANCVNGLENKIKLLKACNAWFLEPCISRAFTAKNKVLYPLFLKENDMLFEEYFARYIEEKRPFLARAYINVTWTNLYCNRDYDNNLLQSELDALPKDWKYFTVVQFDEGPKYNTLPPNTLQFGCCEGDIPIPLIYESHSFPSFEEPIPWKEKTIFCSFVGSLTHTVRDKMLQFLKSDYSCHISTMDGELFIDTTRASKFTLAPRGFGRSSFRFYEILKLGSIPVYIWDDVCWLPYQEDIDYSKLCVCIHESELDKLDSILRDIDENSYINMLNYYSTVKHMFTYEYMCRYIIQRINSDK